MKLPQLFFCLVLLLGSLKLSAVRSVLVDTEYALVYQVINANKKEKERIIFVGDRVKLRRQRTGQPAFRTAIHIGQTRKYTQVLKGRIIDLQPDFIKLKKGQKEYLIPIEELYFIRKVKSKIRLAGGIFLVLGFGLLLFSFLFFAFGIGNNSGFFATNRTSKILASLGSISVFVGIILAAIGPKGLTLTEHPYQIVKLEDLPDHLREMKK